MTAPGADYSNDRPRTRNDPIISTEAIVTVNQNPLTPQEIASLFVTVPPPPNTFELALVLGGTVSFTPPASTKQCPPS
jgi:hypothetical protein